MISNSVQLYQPVKFRVPQNLSADCIFASIDYSDLRIAIAVLDYFNNARRKALLKFLLIFFRNGA